MAQQVPDRQTPDKPYLSYRVHVARVQRIGETFRRFTFTGPTAHLVADTGYDTRIKLVVPTDGLGVDAFPLVDDWYARWRETPADERLPFRTYTLRGVRHDVGEFDVDVALHGRIGPASTWATEASIGDEAVVIAPNANATTPGPGIDWHPPRDVDNVLLAGDETAAPAIAGILERLDPDTRGYAVVELPDEADAAVLGAKPDGVRLVVLGRGSAEPGSALIPKVREIADRLVDGDGSTAEAAPLEDVDVDTTLLWEAPTADVVPARAPLYAWLAGEAAVIKTLRRHLVSERGVDRKAVAFMGYWRKGRSERA